MDNEHKQFNQLKQGDIIYAYDSINKKKHILKFKFIRMCEGEMYTDLYVVDNNGVQRILTISNYSQRFYSANYEVNDIPTASSPVLYSDVDDFIENIRPVLEKDINRERDKNIDELKVGDKLFILTIKNGEISIEEKEINSLRNVTLQIHNDGIRIEWTEPQGCGCNILKIHAQQKVVKEFDFCKDKNKMYLGTSRKCITDKVIEECESLVKQHKEEINKLEDTIRQYRKEQANNTIE